MVATNQRPARMDSNVTPHTICGVFCHNRCAYPKWTAMDVTNAHERIVKKATRKPVHCNGTYGKLTMPSGGSEKVSKSRSMAICFVFSSSGTNVAVGKTFGAWCAAKDSRRARTWNDTPNRRFVYETICSDISGHARQKYLKFETNFLRKTWTWISIDLKFNANLPIQLYLVHCTAYIFIKISSLKSLENQWKF